MLRNVMNGKQHFKMDRSESRWLVSWMMVVGAGIGLMSAPMVTSASSIESKVAQAAISLSVNQRLPQTGDFQTIQAIIIGTILLAITALFAALIVKKKKD
ncbi:LPXTG cell wall anchor domain-containing protein [Lentilactobacillus kefiri]|uniref:LPXTG cell wall anchor domain-containing protein n=1 Tax=Lentilactobacillus kefiri TaxID=33962 RepID=UPI0013A5A850|nr:LPXTG cell wall anchor domain-containing protein [Lentilactobacillus kefiri]MCJ2162537.1 LPXTG cell wall anchor domain-containing protein [Lentilactobacillus kefiri]MCP9369745.1 LPXTG cell wall anchor domain-containing protein [Lentilactobacillus kefiri]MDM7493908.1 LPXTG cell wall anchor domain-containing protein [Lentilactobacillus kefiri]UOD78898.1 LPXTG cell wall anchor domain-containing protein [Lentilactobacillus kefiri]